MAVADRHHRGSALLIQAALIFILLHERQKRNNADERTIKAHRHRGMKKMQVRSLTELVSFAERVGVLGDASD